MATFPLTFPFTFGEVAEAVTGRGFIDLDANHDVTIALQADHDTTLDFDANHDTTIDLESSTDQT